MPVGLNQVTPIPIIVHQVPDFDQDSWTENPTEKPSSVTTQPNHNNNNNNSFFSDGQTTSQCSAGDQAFDRVCTSNSDPTDQISRETSAITNGATTASTPSELSGDAVASETLTTDDMAVETLTTDDMAIETLTTNGTAAEPETTNETTSGQPTINGEDAQESSTASQDMVQ